MTPDTLSPEQVAPWNALHDALADHYGAVHGRIGRELVEIPCSDPGCDGAAWLHPTTLRREDVDPEYVACDECVRASIPADVLAMQSARSTTCGCGEPLDADGSCEACWARRHDDIGDELGPLRIEHEGPLPGDDERLSA